MPNRIVRQIEAEYEAALRTLPFLRSCGRMFGRQEDARCFEGHRRKARRKQVSDSMTTTDWRRLLGYFGNRCAYCHRVSFKLQADHIQPFDKGGEHVALNVAPACKNCNYAKANRNIIECLIGGLFNA